MGHGASRQKFKYLADLGFDSWIDVWTELCAAKLSRELPLRSAGHLAMILCLHKLLVLPRGSGEVGKKYEVYWPDAGRWEPVEVIRKGKKGGEYVVRFFDGTFNHNYALEDHKLRPLQPGRRVEVYWSLDDAWYGCTVGGLAEGKHTLYYDDGETEVVDLMYERLRQVCEKAFQPEEEEEERPPQPREQSESHEGGAALVKRAVARAEDLGSAGRVVEAAEMKSNLARYGAVAWVDGAKGIRLLVVQEGGAAFDQMLPTPTEVERARPEIVVEAKKRSRERSLPPTADEGVSQFQTCRARTRVLADADNTVSSSASWAAYKKAASVLCFRCCSCDG